MKTIFFDIETDALLDDMTLVHCIGLAEDHGKTEAYGPDDLEAGVDRLLTAERLVGHNIIGFDIPALMKYERTNHIKDFDASIRDTLICSRLLYPDLKEDDWRRMHSPARKDFPKDIYGRHSLKAWGYRLGIHKGMYLEETENYGEYTEDMADYCKRDVDCVRTLWHALEQGR